MVPSLPQLLLSYFPSSIFPWKAQQPLAPQAPPNHGGSFVSLSAASVVHLGSRAYYINSDSQWAINISSHPGLRPASVIRFDSPPTQQTVKEKIATFENADDVFSRDFLNVVLVNVTSGERCMTVDDTLPLFSGFGTKEVHFLDEVSQDAIPEGPFFIQSNILHQTWRLYADTYDAFVSPTIQMKGESDKYLPLDVSFPSSGKHVAVAVPSRLYYPPSPAKPLNGLRVGVKDNIHLQGVKTAGSSRAFFDTYSAQSVSAPAIQRLVDLGAVVVGKTGLSQFADAEDPTGDYVDYHCALNPRGDGYRSPGGSSSGSGAAVAAYDWLDFSIGTDTGGSVRVPASYQGVFGFRPSRGRVSLDGSLKIHQDLDAIGPIARSLSLLKSVTNLLTHESPGNSSLGFRRLVYPRHLFPVEDPVAQKSYELAIVAAEKALKLRAEEVDLHKLWEYFRSNITTEPYEDYFSSVLMNYVSWGSWNERAQFRSDHLEKFGRPPIVNPVTRYRWQLGSNMSKETFDRTKQRRQEFEMFMEHVFKQDTVMITPFKADPPNPRDQYRLSPPDRDPAELAVGLRSAFQAPLAGQPEVVFPIGLLSEKSPYSHQTENYAVMASLVGPPGFDLPVINAAAALLEAAQLPLVVKTGKSPFDTTVSPPRV